MKSFFDGIQWLFENVLFIPYNFLRLEELNNWWIANIFSWAFVIIGIYYASYWIKQLKIQKENNEDNQDTTAHSFLK